MTGPDEAALRTAEERRAARRAAARRHHPDLGGDPAEFVRALAEVEAQYAAETGARAGSTTSATSRTSTTATSTIRTTRSTRARRAVRRSSRRVVRELRARIPAGWPGSRRFGRY